LRVQNVLTLTTINPAPQAPLARPVVHTERGAANTTTNPCSPPTAKHSPTMLKQRGAQQVGGPIENIGAYT
jgi:hypothetical protein